MFEKKHAKHEHEHEQEAASAEPAAAPAPAAAAPSDPHMTRPEFIQSLHRSVNDYAEHWDSGHADTPEPTTRSAWRADFAKFLSHD